jgi:hypothetical protein
MYGIGQSLEGTLRSILYLLAFIDERENERLDAFSTFEKSGFWGPFGTAGALAGALGGGLDQTDEIAAVYARLASRLGYYHLENRVAERDWIELERLQTWPADWPRTASTIEAQLGMPSFRCAGQRPTVFAYAGPSDEAWLFLVFSTSEDQELQSVILPRYPLGPSVIDLRPRAITASPEEVYRNFLIATVEGDVATIRKLIVHRRDPLPFFAKPYPADVARLLTEQYRAMDVVRVSPPGETVHLISDGCPLALAVVKDGSSWLVDPDPLIRVLAARE